MELGLILGWKFLKNLHFCGSVPVKPQCCISHSQKQWPFFQWPLNVTKINIVISKGSFLIWVKLETDKQHLPCQFMLNGQNWCGGSVSWILYFDVGILSKRESIILETFLNCTVSRSLISPLQVSQILYDSLRPQSRNFIFEQLCWK